MLGMEQPPSVREELTRLKIGETFSKCERVPFNSVSRDSLAGVALRQRNVLTNAVRRAMRDTSYQFQIETGEVVGREAVLVVVAVTRMH